MEPQGDHQPHNAPYNYSQLPPELLQVVGGSLLSSEQLRNARLVCTGWAKALAHCMPAVTVALPRQASDRIFRQPLVLCSSGVLNSAQSQDYSAVPRSVPQHSSAVLGRRRSCRHSHDGSSPACSSRCKRTCMGSTCSSHSASIALRSQTEPGVGPSALEESSLAAAAAEAQAVSRDKPSPFATEMGQAVLDCLLEDPLLAAGAAKGKPACPAAAVSPGSALCPSIPRIPRMRAIKAAISMPPTLAEQAAAAQQQQAMLPDGQQMRKLASVPASNAQALPRTRRVSKQGAAVPAGQQQQAAQPGPHHVVTTMGPALQGWSSLPSAGLRTCSSLKQLHLKLSGAPPSPEDLMDLSKLVHLTHLSFKQVDALNTDELHSSDLDSPEMHCSSGGTTSSSSELDGVGANSMAVPAASTAAVAAYSKATECAGPSGIKRSHSTGPVRLETCMGQCSDVDAATAAAACALEGCHIHGAGAVLANGSSCMPAHLPNGWAAGQEQQLDGQGACSTSQDGCSDVSMLSSSESDQDNGVSADDAEAAAARDQSYTMGSDGLVANQSLSCAVISAAHVMALAQLPFLSSLELAPKAGCWDAVSREGLLHLVKLTGLTRLSITWGNSAAAAGPLGVEDAAAAAQGEQLPLQKCLAGLTSLQELCISGAAVVDVAVLQRLQQLRRLSAEGLQVVSSDVMAQIVEGEQQQAQLDQQAQADQQQQQPLQAQPVLSAAVPAAGAAAGGQPQGGRWASLPHLQYVHAVHPASDISLLLQSTVTPQLSHLGFVTRGPSDFARLLGQHGKLRTLHLAFAEEESWHPIAVVRLPTALPSLNSLTIEGSFWLPNSLIVGLGVMEVPLEHLSLTCRLAPACLQRLQHLKRLKRLALHHVPAAAGSKGATDAMLQLPAKLLPPQLQELEISNGWILH